MLRINTKQYRRYICSKSQPIKCKLAPTTKNTFLKVENPLAKQIPVALRLEFTRKDGAILNCYYPNTKTLHETVQWFMEA
jgi:hypothetical protein